MLNLNLIDDFAYKKSELIEEVGMNKKLVDRLFKDKDFPKFKLGVYHVYGKDLKEYIEKLKKIDMRNRQPKNTPRVLKP